MVLARFRSLILAFAPLSTCGAASALPLTGSDAAVLQDVLRAAEPDVNDYFGFSLDVSGDRAVLGAWHEDSAATGVNGDQSDESMTQAGCAYVFVRNGSSWVQEAYLKASNPDPGDQFGFAVAIDVDTAVVSTRFEASAAQGVDGDQSDDSAPNAGAVYVFVRENGAWSQQAYLKASNAEAEDRFGFAVALEGDTLVVGAIDESSGATTVDGDQSDNGTPLAGAAYVFVRSNGAWSQQAYLKASNAGADDRFGASIGVSGDTVLIGASSEGGNATGVNGDGSDNSMFRAGAAYVFVRDGTTWSEQAYLKASNTELDDYFGHYVALSGDTAVVGAEREDGGSPGVNGDQSDNSAQNSGAAYVFVRDGTTWTQQAYLKASNPGAFDQFGVSVSVSGDRLLVGSEYEDSGAPGVGGDQSDDGTIDAGAAYYFTRRGTQWVQRAYLKSATPAAGDTFGFSLAVDGETALVSSFFEDGAAPNEGATYAFDLSEPVTSFCFGDGADGVACPCGNDSATGARRGCVHSRGYGAALSASGSTLFAEDDLVLHVTAARAGQPAMFVQGVTSIALPFKDGKLCVGGFTERLELAFLDATGGASTQRSVASNGVVPGPGVARSYQAWFRDPAVSPCGSGSNLTNALRVQWR
ncbi:MAG: FG-GAP repeat protein [Planctomycetes bacterium]|nr:FG-GAP repeat protein [Planctomycetota bacterium]